MKWFAALGSLRLLAVVLVAMGLVQGARAAVTLTPVVSGLSSSLYVTSARDGTNRLFIVEQAGRIKVLSAGATTPILYLDIASKVLSTGSEQGLLGLAFHPQFASNGRFFVNYTRKPDGATVVAEYRAFADPATTAGSESVLLVVAQPFANHNGGMTEFGPDGFLYIGMGDGGSANDPDNRAQNKDELLGKILRIDVDHPAGGNLYSSPAGNPFVGATAGRGEIYALGLRNPFRFSFDRLTGQLWVGDVGQGAIEEVDIVTAGGNYGWRVYEGTQCTNLDPSLCTPSNYAAPIVQYSHTGGRCSITGGYVYRGPAGTLPAGTYVFGDYCTGEIFQLPPGGSATLLLDTSLNISSFGEDEAGEIYVVGLGGTVHRLTNTVASSSNVALASAGAVASVSSSYGAGFAASAINNNERSGAPWANGGSWADGTPSSFPDAVEIAFNGSKTIDRVVVYTVQDNFSNPVEPTDSMTFAAYGITAFTVEGWTGTAWTQLAAVTNNNLIKRSVTFNPFTTTRIRVTVNAARGAYSLLTEVEAWGSSATASPSTAAWSTFGRDAQHTALSTTASQPLNRIHWQMPVDLQPQYNGTSLLAHYGSPLMTAANTVLVPVKTGVAGAFRVEARSGSNGGLLWSMNSDYVLPAHSWVPAFGPALSSQSRLYFPGAGGRVYFRDQADATTGPSGQMIFYGLANYQANPQAYDAGVIINTPLTIDPSGNLYFGFQVTGSTPLGLTSGIARISADGQATWTPVTTASADAGMLKVPHNSAPALSVDHRTLYVAVSNGSSGYLVALDSTTLAPLARVALVDPRSGQPGTLSDNGSASPTVGPDGDVYFGVLENPFGSNHRRGWLLHFNASLSQVKTPAAFGWDTTAGVVPAQMVPSYQGASAYLLATKYNHYLGLGGDGQNKVAILDPGTTQVDPVTQVTVMKEVLTMLGPTPESGGGVKEWCINTAAVDPATQSILANNEDGKLYRWDLATNTLSQVVVLTAGLGEAYTSTVIGPDGKVYATNNATLFAVGR